MASTTTNHSKELTAACEAADRAISVAYRTYVRQDYAAAAAACLTVALVANKEGASVLADEYGKKHARMNKRACGGW
jgi:hypothetical protein